MTKEEDMYELSAEEQAEREARIVRHVERLKGLDVGELLALVRYHENHARDEGFFQWLYRQGSSKRWRAAVRRNEIEDAVERLLAGKDLYKVRGKLSTPKAKIQEAIDQAFEEFARVERTRPDGGAMWRCYLAENPPDPGSGKPATVARAEDLAARARLLKELLSPVPEDEAVGA